MPRHAARACHAGRPVRAWTSSSAWATPRAMSNSTGSQCGSVASFIDHREVGTEVVSRRPRSLGAASCGRDRQEETDPIGGAARSIVHQGELGLELLEPSTTDHRPPTRSPRRDTARWFTSVARSSRTPMESNSARTSVISARSSSAVGNLEAHVGGVEHRPGHAVDRVRRAVDQERRVSEELEPHTERTRRHFTDRPENRCGLVIGSAPAGKGMLRTRLAITRPGRQAATTRSTR